MNYSTTVTTPDKLSADELVEAMESIHHISKRYLKEYFPKAKSICLIRCDCCEGIVGVGAIKSSNTSRSMRVGVVAGYPFSVETCELGYVTVHHKWRGVGLGKLIVKNLVLFHDGQLWATTSDERMARTLLRYGFKQAGNNWIGEREQTLGLWIRD